MNKVDDKTISEVFQEIMLNFSRMEPTDLDQLENKVLDAIHKLGSYLMEWKLDDWDEQLRKEHCETCNGKLENRKRHRQVVTWVSDVNIDRYMSYCPVCKKSEYPLDKVLGLEPRQRMSSQVEELTTLCGASWKYGEAEYLMKKILRRYCVSHNTIQEITHQVGNVAFQKTEGSKIKQLEEDKLAQGDYFENMELWAVPKARIYMDMDGVMINSRDNTKRMEGKAAVVWSERELVKKDTYSLTDKRYMGSFTDTESFSWDVVSSESFRYINAVVGNWMMSSL